MRDVPGLAWALLSALIGAGQDRLDSACLPESTTQAGLMLLYDLLFKGEEGVVIKFPVVGYPENFYLINTDICITQITFSNLYSIYNLNEEWAQRTGC